MIFDASNDLLGHRLHLMHLYVEVQSPVELVMNWTRRESMLSETYDEVDLQQQIINTIKGDVNMRSEHAINHNIGIRILSYTSSSL